MTPREEQVFVRMATPPIVAALAIGGGVVAYSKGAPPLAIALAELVPLYILAAWVLAEIVTTKHNRQPHSDAVRAMGNYADTAKGFQEAAFRMAAENFHKHLVETAKAEHAARQADATRRWEAIASSKAVKLARIAIPFKWPGVNCPPILTRAEIMADADAFEETIIRGLDRLEIG